MKLAIPRRASARGPRRENSSTTSPPKAKLCCSSSGPRGASIVNKKRLVDDIAKEFKGRDLVVLAVDVLEPDQTVRRYLAEHPRSVPVVLTKDTNLAAMYNAQVYPIYVVIDREGNIAAEQRGAAGERGLRRMLRRAGVDSDSQ
jgi:hypothetical protein